MLFWKKKHEVTLIVGLGNPGAEYARNRHNIGFMCIDYLAKTHAIQINKKQGDARTGAGEISGQKVLLSKPQTFVNRSGQAVGQLLRRYHVTRDHLIVIHDDLDLPPGKIRIRQGGSPAGHKGITSIADSAGSQDFIRVRIGIGRPEPAGNKEAEVIDYVLSDLTPEEEETFSTVMIQVSDAIDSLITRGIEETMNRFN